MEDFIVNYKSVLGIEADELSVLQILTRCIFIYVIGIALVRLGNKRFIGKMTAFDIIIAIIIGSLLSRTITEKDLFFETLAACLLLILVHRLFSLIAAYSDRFGDWIKGHERVVVQDGEILWDALHKSNLSKQDLMQTLRLNARVSDITNVQIARLERNGDISIILKNEDR
jgi:uncharacterized membrane protein YcaP (DUF421 family)